MPTFKILKKSKKSQARIGKIETAHGVLRTPAFFPVATAGAIKTLDWQDVEKIGFEAVLCNTYHLMLRPGSDLIEKMGGLHKFMNYNGVIATDSGGFQVFSLGKGIEQGVGKVAKAPPDGKPQKACSKQPLVKIREQGVYFNSHIDGKKYFLSPERSIKIQQDLGADIIFAFDECTSPFDTLEYTKKAMERTHRWAERCLAARKAKPKSKRAQTRPNIKQMLFGITQGGLNKNLRIKSAKFIGAQDFDGFGIGGALGVELEQINKKMFDILGWTIPLLPPEKPRHLLGIGSLDDMKKSVKYGIDLFDCVYPTRMARHGSAITSQGIINLNKAVFLNDKNPIDKKCSCPACQNYSRAYIAHLFRAKEITGMRLLTLHNLCFFKSFMDKIRKDITDGKL